MTDIDRDERFAPGEHPRASAPSSVLCAHEPAIPGGDGSDANAGGSDPNAGGGDP